MGCTCSPGRGAMSIYTPSHTHTPRAGSGPPPPSGQGLPFCGPNSCKDADKKLGTARPDSDSCSKASQHNELTRQEVRPELGAGCPLGNEKAGIKDARRVSKPGLSESPGRPNCASCRRPLAGCPAAWAPGCALQNSCDARGASTRPLPSAGDPHCPGEET